MSFIKVLRFLRRLPTNALTKYLQTNARYPIATAISTSAVLWISGDTLAQIIEAKGEDKPLDMRRLIATTTEGSLVNGGVGCLWYQLLDKVTTQRSAPKTVERRLPSASRNPRSDSMPLQIQAVPRLSSAGPRKAGPRVRPVAPRVALHLLDHRRRRRGPFCLADPRRASPVGSARVGLAGGGGGGGGTAPTAGAQARSQLATVAAHHGSGLARHGVYTGGGSWRVAQATPPPCRAAHCPTAGARAVEPAPDGARAPLAAAAAATAGTSFPRWPLSAASGRPSTPSTSGSSPRGCRRARARLGRSRDWDTAVTRT